MDSLLNRLTTSVRRLAAFFGGTPLDEVDTSGADPTSQNTDEYQHSSDTVEAMENELAAFMGAVLNIGPVLSPEDAIKTITTLESWLDAYKGALPFPVTRSIVERMMDIATHSEIPIDSEANGLKLDPSAIKDRYAFYFEDEADQLDAMYEDEEAEEPREAEDDENVFVPTLADSREEKIAAEALLTRLKFLEEARDWKETRTGAYVKELVDKISPFLGDPTLEVGSGRSLARAIAFASSNSSCIVYPALVPTDAPDLPALASSAPSNLRPPISVDPMDTLYHQHGSVQQVRKFGSAPEKLPKEFTCLVASCVESLKYQAPLAEYIFRGAKKLVKAGGKLVIVSCLDAKDMEEWAAGPAPPREEPQLELPLVVATSEEEQLAQVMGRIALTGEQLADQTLDGPDLEGRQGREAPIRLPELVSQQLSGLAWRNYFVQVLADVVVTDKLDGASRDDVVKGLLVLVYERDDIAEDDDVDLTVFQ